MYNQLPSTVVRDGTTFDIMVTDVYATWEKHNQNPSDATQYDEGQLVDFVKKVKGEE
jgi:hypothetical protein